MTGGKAMSDRMRRLAKSTPEAIAAALYQETEIEAKEVKRRTPVDQGTLRSSVHVVGPLWRNMRKFVYTLIACGGPAAPYAVYVHENLTAFHKVGQAKFLESVIMESRPYIAARVARRLKFLKGA